MLNTIHANLDKWIVSFVTIAVSSLVWPDLPSLILLLGLFVLACGLFILPKGIFLCGAIFGVIWMASLGHWQLDWQLPRHQISQIHQISGTVNSIVRHSSQIRFNFVIDSINGNAYQHRSKVRLSWQSPNLIIKQGNQLSLRVKLKPPHGLANEGGFNYQQWLISENIVATGYVKNSATNRIESTTTTIRQILQDRLSALNLKHESWIAALSIGDRSLFEKQDWQLIQSTGTAHLIAISGLHLGIVAFWSYWLSGVLLRFILCLFQLKQGVDYRRIILLVVLVCTFCYSSIAGFSLPTIRAWLMLVFVSLLLFTRNYWSVTAISFYCLFLAILLNPLSILSISFWLSFLAIFMIWLVMWRWPVTHITQDKHSVIQTWKRNFVIGLRLQVMLSVLMIPIVAWQFSMVSASSTLVNLVAVPMVTFVLVPLCLLGSLLLTFNLAYAKPLFSFIDQIIARCIDFLEWIDGSEMSSFQLPEMPFTVWSFALLAGLLLLLPGLSVKRALIPFLFLPVMSFYLPTDNNDWKINVLDVGQGLSIVVMRNHKVLIYDVGGAFPSGFNMADAVILPFLQRQGIKNIDTLIISHFDNDHAGSLPYLKKHKNIEHFITTKNVCHQSLALSWQNLQIQSLWPRTIDSQSSNDKSCVVRISDGKWSILLAGDISSAVEHKLVAKQKSQLPADILIAPHHGSNTSSSYAFIQAVNAAHVVFSAGYQNRWQFPRQEVINRYVAATSSRLYSTAETGQISFTMTESEIKTETYRGDIFSVWYNRFLDQ